MKERPHSRTTLTFRVTETWIFERVDEEFCPVCEEKTRELGWRRDRRRCGCLDYWKEEKREKQAERLECRGRRGLSSQYGSARTLQKNYFERKHWSRRRTPENILVGSLADSNLDRKIHGTWASVPRTLYSWELLIFPKTFELSSRSLERTIYLVARTLYTGYWSKI